MKKTPQSEFLKSDNLYVKEEKLQRPSHKLSVSSAASIFSHNSSRDSTRRQSCVRKLSEWTLTSHATAKNHSRQRRFKINIPNGEMLIMDGNQSLIVSAVDDLQKSSLLPTYDADNAMKGTSLFSPTLPQTAMKMRHSLNPINSSSRLLPRRSSCFAFRSKPERIRKVQVLHSVCLSLITQ